MGIINGCKSDITNGILKGAISAGDLVMMSNSDYIFEKYAMVQANNRAFKNAMTTAAMQNFIEKYGNKETYKELNGPLGGHLFVAMQYRIQNKPVEAAKVLEDHTSGDPKYWTEFLDSMEAAVLSFQEVMKIDKSPAGIQMAQALSSELFGKNPKNKKTRYELRDFMQLYNGQKSSTMRFISKFMKDIKNELSTLSSMDDAARNLRGIDITKETPVSKQMFKNAIEGLGGIDFRGGGFWRNAQRSFNKYLRLNGPIMLMAGAVSPAGWMLGITALTAGIANYNNLLHNRSTKEMKDGLKQLGVANDGKFFRWDQIKTGKGLHGKMGFNKLVKDAALGIQYVLGDTVFRPGYQVRALELALHRLSRDGSVNEYITQYGDTGKVDSEGRPIIDHFVNEGAKQNLIYQYEKALAEITGNSLEDGGVTTTRGYFNKVFSYISGWSTRYTNTTLRNLSQGKLTGKVADLVSTGYYNADGAATLVAQNLVTRQEVARERSKLAYSIKLALRFNRQMSTCDEDDDMCHATNFLGATYLPAQAYQMAHPLVAAIVKGVGQFIEGNPFIDDDTPRTIEAQEIFYKYLVRPFLRAGYTADLVAGITHGAIEGEDPFIEMVLKTLTEKSNNIMGYLSEDIRDFVKGDNAYTPKNLMLDDAGLFGINGNKFREEFSQLVFANKVMNRDLYGNPIDSFLRNVPMIRHWMFPNSYIGTMINTLESEPGYQQLTRGEIPEDAINNFNRVKKAYMSLTKDRQAFGAEFKDGIREDSYNTPEIKLGENYLKEILQGNHNISYEQLLSGIESELGTEEYNQIKQLIDIAPNYGSPAYLDFLSNYQNNSRMSGVKGLALAAEAWKYKRMRQEGLYYRKKDDPYPADEVVKMDLIEQETVARYAPFLYLADRKQRHDISMFYFADKYDGTNGTEDYKQYFNITNDSITGEYDYGNLAKDTRIEGSLNNIALWAVTLSRTEMAEGNIDGFMLNNVLTEKLYSYNQNTNDPERVATYVNTITYFADVLDDLGYSDIEKTMMLMPSLSQNTQLYLEMRENPAVVEALGGGDKINKMDDILYQSYQDTMGIPDAEANLKLIQDHNSATKSGYKPSSGYYGPYNTYDKFNNFTSKYSTPARIFTSAFRNNLDRMSQSYANNRTSDLYTVRREYSPREWARLNARPRFHDIISRRAAPDIQQGSGTFSRKSAKVKGIWGSNTLRTSREKKVPKSFSNKIIIRGETLDGSRASRETRGNNPDGYKSKSKDVRTYSGLGRST